jgi:hypothetical protein
MKMKITKKQLKRLIEMAVRDDIRTALTSEQRTVLIPYEFDISKVGGQQQFHVKPNGLWYGFGTSWMDFAQQATGIQHMYDESDYLYEIQVQTTTIDNPDPNKVLRMTSSQEVNSFLQKYPAQRVGQFKMLDWAQVANDFAGIELLDEADSSFGGWDIDSGCVWNPAAISGVQQLADPPSAPPQQQASAPVAGPPSDEVLEAWEEYENWSEAAKEALEEYFENTGDDWKIGAFEAGEYQEYGFDAYNAIEALDDEFGGVNVLDVELFPVKSSLALYEKLRVLALILNDGVSPLSFGTAWGTTKGRHGLDASDYADKVNEMLNSVLNEFGLPGEFDIEDGNSYDYETRNY